MPIYTFLCHNGHRYERFLRVASLEEVQMCFCNAPSEVTITPPLMVKVAQDVCYDSPIDGKPITSWAQRQEDLARSNCQPYDPEMKTDYTNRVKASERELDQAVGETVEEAIAKMPTQKRGKLYSEMAEQGHDLAVVRGTKED